MSNFALADLWAIERVMKKHPKFGFHDLASSSHILVAMIEKAGNLKIGDEGGNFMRQTDMTGARAIIPVLFALGQGELVTRAGMYSAMTINAPGTNGYDYADYAKFEYSTIRLAFRLDWRMRNFLTNTPEDRMQGYDPYALEIQRMKKKNRALIETGLESNNNAAENTILGLQYLYPDTPSGSANAPGGWAYNDANYGALWRPGSRNIAGAWTASYLTQGQMETRFDSSDEGTMAADLCLMVEPTGTTTPKLYSALLDTFLDQTRIPNNADMKALGYSNVMWDGGAGLMTIAPLSGGVTGTVYFLRSDMHYIGMEESPIPDEQPQRVDATNALEYMFVSPFCHAVAGPKRETKQYGFL